MKCRELMVGDWCCSGHGLPMRITNVGEDYAYATFEGNECDPWEFDDKIDAPNPIPIIREFLEKNGCTWHERIWGYDMRGGKLSERFASRLFPDSKTYLEWYESNKTLAIWFDYLPDNEGTYSDIVIPVRYVHEMQQVLRLAGLDDIANELKI